MSQVESDVRSAAKKCYTNVHQVFPAESLKIGLERDLQLRMALDAETGVRALPCQHLFWSGVETDQHLFCGQVLRPVDSAQILSPEEVKLSENPAKMLESM